MMVVMMMMMMIIDSYHFQGTELGWREILASVAEMDLWEGTRRELRTEWRDYLAEAAALLHKPRKPLPEVNNTDSVNII